MRAPEEPRSAHHSSPHSSLGEVNPQVWGKRQDQPQFQPPSDTLLPQLLALTHPAILGNALAAPVAQGDAWHWAGAGMSRSSSKEGPCSQPVSQKAGKAPRNDIPMAMGQEGNSLLAEGGRQETSYRALHLLGQHTELWRAGVLIGIQEFPAQNPQVAIENLLDGGVPVWKGTAQGQEGQSGLGSVPADPQ